MTTMNEGARPAPEQQWASMSLFGPDEWHPTGGLAPARDRISSSNSTATDSTTCTEGSSSSAWSQADGDISLHFVGKDGSITCQYCKDGIVCGRVFPNMKSFKSHTGLHKTKSYYCQEIKGDNNKVCKAKFNTAKKLQRHIEGVHQGVRPHECTVCNKGFAYKANLKTHMKLHSAQREFKCGVPGCNREFAQASNRNSHEATHRARLDKELADDLTTLATADSTFLDTTTSHILPITTSSSSSSSSHHDMSRKKRLKDSIAHDDIPCTPDVHHMDLPATTTTALKQRYDVPTSSASAGLAMILGDSPLLGVGDCGNMVYNPVRRAPSPIPTITPDFTTDVLLSDFINPKDPSYQFDLFRIGDYNFL